jgi:hypothetical protein
LVWSLAFLGVYAVQLPVGYQHGRYAMPMIPALIVMGVEGLSGWAQLLAANTFRRIASRAWLSVVAAIVVTFWLLGCRAYAQDVAILALWVTSVIVNYLTWLA